MHLGSIAVDYSIFLEFTKMILEIPNFYIVLVGDDIDNFVNFKNMLAIHQQIISPAEQDAFFESWLNEVQHKILFATWGNHAEFDEKYTGKNSSKAILNKRVIYFNGIGKAVLQINKTAYSIAVTHRTRYFSQINRLHGIKRMARETIQGCDIYIAGDRHDPAFEFLHEGGNWQVMIQLGTFKTNDSYSKRYFAYKTSPIMPCVILSTKEKTMTPVRTWQEAVNFTNGGINAD